MILGLDVSTSVIGYTILDEEAKIIECGHGTYETKGTTPTSILRLVILKINY